MVTRRAALLGAGLMAAGRRAWAAAYPARPVRIIVPFAPGGPTDIMARVVAGRLGERLAGSFIVENRPGAGSNIGTGVAAHAEPDGYTLLITSSAFVVNPGLYKRVPYDPLKDFAPIAELGTSPNIFLADPKTGIATIAELVAKAKADPAALSYASAGIGTTPHLSGELLKADAGISMTHVPYPGGNPAMQAVLGSVTPIGCVSLPPTLQLVATGALNALAVTGASRWPDLPAVPSLVELGFAGFPTDTFQGFLAPAGTPTDITDLLARTAVDVLHDPATAAQLKANGFEVLANGPEGMRRRIADEVPKWRNLVAKAGITPV